MRLRLRRRLPGAEGTQVVTTVEDVAPARLAIVVCDMWDTHWCRTTAARTEALAARIVPVLDAARTSGALIVHAPSDATAFYADTRQRRWMADLRREPVVQSQAPFEPSFVVRSGCADEPQCAEVTRPPWPWTRQHPSIPIEDHDGISDDGDEIVTALQARGIARMLLAGVHTEFCILDRPFGVRAMVRRGVRCAVVRDLTEASVPDQTEIVVRHVERYLCPTISSEDLLAEGDRQ